MVIHILYSNAVKLGLVTDFVILSKRQTEQTLMKQSCFIRVSYVYKYYLPYCLVEEQRSARK